MTPEELAALRASLGLDTIEKGIVSLQQKDILAAKEKAELEQAERENARVQKLVDAAVGETKTRLESTVKLVGELEKQLSANNVEAFAKTIEDMQKELTERSNEITQILNARTGKSAVALGVSNALDSEAEIEKAVLLSAIMKKEIGETSFGATVLAKAVNGSSSIAVASEAFETIFSSRILRDVQKLLVVGAMFAELPMTTKSLTMQIEPTTAGSATWVAAASFGTSASTGSEVTAALTEITFSTFKLAAKAYMTDETEEDAITALLPIIRRHLVESHAEAIEAAFMGDSTASTIVAGKPTGLLRYAKIDSNTTVTTAKADGTVKVKGSMIHALRRKLGLKGLNLSKLALVVSMDAYYDLIEDEDFKTVDSVGPGAALLLQGQVGRMYGLPVVVSSYFPAKAVSKEFCAIVYRDDFIVPRQRSVTFESDREAGNQRDAYYVTQRLNLQRFFTSNVVTGTYAAA
jgi:HK97 family phage major capsid protein